VIFSNETSSKIPEGYIASRRHISVPIIYKEESIGLIHVANKKTDYSREDVEVLKTITSYIAPILHARIQKEIWEKEHRQAVRELKRSEESLAQAQRIALLGNWDFDLINDELRWSDEIYRIFGLKPQEFGATYEAFLNAVHPNDREYVDKAYSNSVRNNTPYDIIHRIVRPDGEIRYVHEKAEDIKDETGRTVRSVGTVQDITERKLVEKELMLTQFTMNNAVDSAFWIGPDARFTYINETACQSLGYSREELLTMTVHDIDPNFPEETWEKHWNELREKGSITLESEHRAKNGTTLPVEIKAHYLEYEGKEYNVAFACDITERKKVEEARKISEERLYRFMESATDAFSIWDSELNLLSLNDSELKMFPSGTKKEELIGSNIRVLSPGIEKTNRYEKYRNVIETGEPCYIDEFIVHPRFGSMYMSIRAFKVGDGMGLITTDITERIMAVKALQESEELNRSIIETATDAFIGMDSCGLITDWNKQAERIFGIPHKDAIGRSFAETILAPDQRDMYISEIGSFMATGKYPFLKEHVELTAIHSDGHEFPVQIKVWPIRLGEEHRFNAFVEDISERMKLQKMKDEFVSTASHELRTPLTTMKEGISQISEGILGPTTKEQDEFLEIIIEDINRLTRIINDLLDMSRIDAEMVYLKIERVDLYDLVKSIFKVFNPRAVEKGLEIRTQFPKERVKVNIDRDKILQVFTNLLDNSIKFTQKGYIGISVSGNGDHAECSVTDTGKGIPEDELPRIFDKFQQFGKMKNPKEKGSGLGLYIVKKIVELHNGEIRVESQPNKGSKFSFTLPKSQIAKNDRIKSKIDP
jgi:PAS domain S-box-containing protein